MRVNTWCPRAAATSPLAGVGDDVARRDGAHPPVAQQLTGCRLGDDRDVATVGEDR
ncbi:hypothetical protein TOK_5790 [Pseudonocardia sp. N23]|nr:hypothetical protein TOK_5790 [Pseudonocardia sp. N23]